jgi:alkylhydroperoxidase family enzyme
MSFRFAIAVLMFAGVGLQILHGEDLTKTRPEMKQRIQALKDRTSRLPLPPPSAEDIASGRMLVNNGRLRSLYLPPSWQSFLVPGWGRPASQPKGGTASLLKSLEASPDYAFKTRLFWVVSRANDCQYCLGHQELKLRRVGMTDDQIAALDCRWDQFPAPEQAALKATRKLTVFPHQFGSSDVAELQKHFRDDEIIDILYTVARYNAVNRWTSSTGIPQDQSFGGEAHSDLDTPTSNEFASIPSSVIPTDVETRPEWETVEQFEAAVKAARSRSALVKLPSEELAIRLLMRDTTGIRPPNWFQAMAKIPVALDAWAQRQAMIREGKTAVDLRLRLAWVTARENRAWYSAAHARARYLASEGDVAKLSSFADLEQAATAGDAEALRFARKLTSAPHTIVDADISRLREHFSDHEVAEIIQVICDANAFDRITEALQLPLESEVGTL